MAVIDFRAELVTQNRLFADLFRGADPGVLALPVPTCPGWSVRQLFRHQGRAYRWTAQIVREGLDGPPDPYGVPEGKPPEDLGAAIDWFHGGVAVLLDAVGRADPDVPVFTWVGMRRPAYWLRRMLHETAVHRADAAFALGAGYALREEVAVDTVTEWLESAVNLVGAAGEAPLAPGRKLHLHATDLDAAWTLRAGAVSVSSRHEKADAAVRGPVVDLLLAVTRRRASGIEVLGDPEIWSTWLEHTKA